jgi:hemerythrin-like domain-containing protein
MNAIQFLKQEHRKAKEAFETLLQAPPDERGRLWDALKPELESHEKIEDRCLYEPLSRDAGAKDETLAGWRAQHQAEVEKVEGLIKGIEGLAPGDTRWMSKVREVYASLERHIREEEGKIFPSIGKVWDEDRLRRAGTEMEDMTAPAARKTEQVSR